VGRTGVILLVLTLLGASAGEAARAALTLASAPREAKAGTPFAVAVRVRGTPQDA
jgi:hypothetical protein